jgi:hypothetical protein
VNRYDRTDVGISLMFASRGVVLLDITLFSHNTTLAQINSPSMDYGALTMYSITSPAGPSLSTTTIGCVDNVDGGVYQLTSYLHHPPLGCGWSRQYNIKTMRQLTMIKKRYPFIQHRRQFETQMEQ